MGTASHGVQVTGSSHVTLAHNRVRGSGGSGIYVADSSDVLLAGNGVVRSTDYGIELVRDQRFTVRDGEVKRSGRPAEGATRKGVYVSACQGGLITAPWSTGTAIRAST